MLKALNKSNIPILSLRCSEDDGPFYCPACRAELIFKDGLVRIPHFAHYPEQDCVYNVAQESESHLYSKVQIWDGLRKDKACQEVDYERYIGRRRPDVWAIINNREVAIEVQNSPITIEDVSEKLNDYHQMGLSCIYVIPHSIPAGTFSPKAWQRYLHAMAFGNLYYWFEKHKVAVIHLGSYKHAPGQICDETFYQQRRPVFRYARYIPITEFAAVFHSDLSIFYRHIGIVNSWMWNFPEADWWEKIHTQSFAQFATVG